MLFNSSLFLIYFIPLLIVVYQFTPKYLKNGILLLTSLLFYCWGEPIVGVLLIGLSFIDYFVLKYLGNRFPSKIKLIAGALIVLHLLLLFYYKYTLFFIENINYTTQLWGEQYFNPVNILLPIGISFYTFQSISAIVDVYKGKTPLSANSFDFVLYIFFFPQLIAGPIIQYDTFAHQISNRNETADKFVEGFIRFAKGLAKKALIANTLNAMGVAMLTKYGMDDLSSIGAWLIMIAYTFEIYFDFSGYSDMAIGLGKIFGFDIPENFNLPYLSRSITEFWQRWHITLGAFMLEYVYIPLGGNKLGNIKMYRNLILVFLISGFWHGSSWNFVLWGMFHGSFILLERIGFRKVLNKLGVFSICITFLIVLHGWVFFRFREMGQIKLILTKMWSFDFSNSFSVRFDNFYYFFLIVAILIVIVGYFIKPQELLGKFKIQRVAIAMLLFILSFMSIVSDDFQPFIYFQF
jgi:alginate O-acetyltransferase complex protein AlgI